MNIITSLVIWLTALSAPGAASGPAQPSFAFHHDGVLGTSADFTFVTPSTADAVRAEAIALAEIERLRRILSSWDSSSEVSRLFAQGALEHPSAELRTVLAQYTTWHEWSGHAYSARAGELSALWQEGAAQGSVPDSLALARVVTTIAAPAWQLDPNRDRIVALTAHRVDLNSLGKGFIIDRVMQSVRDSVPTLRGALVNVGGDIQVWGAAPAGGAWRIAVANPTDHADNAAPLSRLALTGHAVSSSGDYMRGFIIAGRHYSHILDPRSGYPAGEISGVTVIAADNATANALATTLSVLTPEGGVALVATVPGAEAMIVRTNGEIVRTPGFAAYEEPSADVAASQAAAFTAAIAIDITPTEWNHHSPYVAVWVTDTAGNLVRTVAFWGEKPKYQRELTRWFGAAHDSAALIDGITRATRPAGKYTLDWDGLDQRGNPIAPGAYLFWLEVAFEDGAHSSKSVALACGAAHAAGTIAAAAAFGGAEISCDPVKH